jgi:hypothetical protein
MRARLIARGLILVALGGCGATAGSFDGGGTGGGAGSGGQAGGAAGGPSGGAGGAAAIDACGFVAGHTFVSVSLLNCAGINPQTPPCHWSVTFNTDGTFGYFDGGDTGVPGTYACMGAAITGTRGGWPPVSGTYSGSGNQLIWDGQTFVLNAPDAG